MKQTIGYRVPEGISVDDLVRSDFIPIGSDPSPPRKMSTKEKAERKAKRKRARKARRVNR